MNDVILKECAMMENYIVHNDRRLMSGAVVKFTDELWGEISSVTSTSMVIRWLIRNSEMCHSWDIIFTHVIYAFAPIPSILKI
jgi:hypothetical protein